MICDSEFLAFGFCELILSLSEYNFNHTMNRKQISYFCVIQLSQNFTDYFG